MIKYIIRLEYLLQLIVISYIYFFIIDSSIPLFLLLIFVPDISMLGYIGGNKIGARIYNIFHTLIIPTLLLLINYLSYSILLTQVVLIWYAHIFIDRILGYGLKLDSGFKLTHLN
ncbi:hypothetical protein GCM10025879_10850 [Leuconostoc litchii]|uniref:DUF4260 family protein n=1 Tax=Leuconostoc litchii TaxID=1981069 RepID=A0A6P2CK53_9LACO|nr:DUF4260 family protein [Leuconostoc litchii]GMA69839.1 hypothetical protein GCM10025879_10850 [Leuconostoc litchii]